MAVWDEIQKLQNIIEKDAIQVKSDDVAMRFEAFIVSETDEQN